MTVPDFEQARAYALERLAKELSPLLTYHNLEHTRDDVVPASERLARLSGIDDEEIVLLLTAAFYHDIGFVIQRDDHETVGVTIAQEVLPHFGYSTEAIERVSGIIMATKLPQSPESFLGEILADADLDVLGRDDFMVINQALQTERATFDGPLSDVAWYEGQYRFMQKHRYFTAVAHNLRDAKKQENSALLYALLEQARAEQPPQ